jgi:hypothetical protein
MDENKVKKKETYCDNLVGNISIGTVFNIAIDMIKSFKLELDVNDKEDAVLKYKKKGKSKILKVDIVDKNKKEKKVVVK